MVKRKILVVEDSVVVLKVLNHLLSQNPTFSPVLCPCYKEAEKKLKESPGEFFAAIVDLNLPDAENGEIVDLVLSHQIPPIVLTGNISEKVRLNLLNKGVLDYIVKDNRYSFSYVIKVVERLVKNQGVKILVAEDSTTSRLFIKILLKQYGFEVLEAENGQEALAQLEADSDIRMLITDYNMPLVNGYDLVRMLRNNNRFQDLVIIGLSAEGDTSLSAKFIKAGANDFLRKPFYHEEFHCRVIHNLEAQDMLETIRNLANIDQLTKLKNRRHLFEEGGQLFRHRKADVSLAMMDLDFFKKVNDNYGHVVGDSLLELMGEEILEAFPDDLTCRFGGEEFCVISTAPVTEFIAKVKDFLETIRSKEYTDAKLSVTCSVGVCALPMQTLEESIQVADKNLYEAKNLGRDRVVSSI
ncbi:diguanylate cyclase [Marinomonas sp. C2222]|uniref:diguanylate cyclase n=1 Tax=Marinomonas sargassi TaxID=2984494 RepID=A0ABT2YSP1_9GAMM|nr:diguanylate cyclase [Marinomonas sargassi]MCV2402909.1 diguanylate cyclase [Marinomonas sargassi]